MAADQPTIRFEGIDARDLADALSTLVRMASDGVIAFDASFRVLMANPAAERLVRCARGALVGADVRELVHAPGEGTSWEEPRLTFELDGTSVVEARAFDGSAPARATARCEPVGSGGSVRLMTLRAADAARGEAAERERLVEELSDANRRLTGVLHIVLDTLNSAELDDLFSRVASELHDFVGASDVLVYVAGDEEYLLAGHTGALAADRIARAIPFEGAFARLASRMRGAVHLRLASPSRADLRQGASPTRDLVVERTHEVCAVEASCVPPLSSFFLVPVRFGSHVIALLVIGWTVPHAARPDDARLLDAVTQYLSAQIMGAINQLRERRSRELDRAAQELHARLAAHEAFEPACVEELRSGVAAALGASVCPVVADPSGAARCDLPRAGLSELPLGPSELAPEAREGRTTLVPLGPSSRLRRWLAERGEPSVGAYVDAGTGLADCPSLLVLREAGEPALDAAELGFLRRVADDVRSLAAGLTAREGDRRIGQALMRGMRNQLQEVEGLTAHGAYSSATAQAFVGGDFYDLIRLPGRRACVIMGDVSGKGIEAASVSAALRTALGAYAWEGLPPARMVRSLNDFLLGFSRLETFATLFVGVADLVSGTLRYCSAGHPPALLVRSRALVDPLDVQSGVVGAFPGMFYREGEVALAEGDVLLLYTDGATEARSPAGAFFGEEGLRDLVLSLCAAGSGDLAHDVLEAIDEFTGRRLDDDVALVDVTFDTLGDGEDE